ncbi:MAG: hypothetical protein AABX08_03200 [Nanoarchaeota archaeon]
MKKPITDLDYVEFYAKKMKEDDSLFKQQKILIESQLESSSSLFKNMFGKGDNFKSNAREYLKSIGLIKPLK